MKYQEKADFERYKFNKLIQLDQTIYFNRKPCIKGYSWSSFKRFINICKTKYSNCTFIIFPKIKSIIVISLEGKINFSNDEFEQYMYEWLDIDHRINNMPMHLHNDYKRSIRNFKRYGKMPGGVFPNR